MVKSIGSQNKKLALFMAPEYKNKTKNVSNEKKNVLNVFKKHKFIFFYC